MRARYENLLEIDGPPEDVRAFAARVEAGRVDNFGSHFMNFAGLSFGSFVPLPDDASLGTRRMRWGTPYDAHHNERYGAAAAGWLRYEFPTYDAPPTPVVHAMQAQHPRLRIRLHSIDPRTGFEVRVDADGREHETVSETLDPGLDAELAAQPAFSQPERPQALA